MENAIESYLKSGNWKQATCVLVFNWVLRNNEISDVKVLWSYEHYLRDGVALD